MKTQLRFRVSTLLIGVGLLLLPWSSTLLALPSLPPQWGGLQHFFDVMVLDVGPQLFFVAFLVAAVFLAWAVWRRRWAFAVQATGEMLVCVLAVMAVPAY